MVGPPIIKEDRIDKIVAVIEESKTDTQRKVRTDTFNRLVQYIEQSSSDDELYSHLWNDFPVWCLAFLDDDRNMPLFVSKWQIDYYNASMKHRYLWILCSRKIGKSTILSAIVAHILCGPHKERIVVFAPTHGQDFVAKKARAYIMGSQYLAHTFIKDGGNSTNAEMVSATGSVMINRSISINTGGSTIRGEYGSIIIVDEVQEIDQQILDTIVFPMLADAYTEKRLMMVGTPNLFRNPDLESRYNNWAEDAMTDPQYAVMNVDAYRGVDEGCISRDWVEKQKKELPPDDFAMEYLAQFPDTSLRFFPKSLLESCVTNRGFSSEKTDGAKYIMAVDWAKFTNKTQILVGEVTGFNKGSPQINIVEWIMYDPKERRVDYEEQTDKVKQLFHKYDCCWIAPDTTSNQDALIVLLTKDSKNGVPGIPTYAIYGYDTKKVEQRLGFKASESSNFEMWRNHKQQMGKGRIKVPSGGIREQKLVKRWIREHHELQAIPVRNNTLIRLEEQKGGDKDLAVTSAMLSLFLKDYDKPRASFKMRGF